MKQIMPVHMRSFLCLLVLNVAAPFPSPAHDDEFVHPELSTSAARSSSGLVTFLVGCFGAGAASLTQPSLTSSDGTRTPLQWLRLGSQHEDGQNKFEEVKRTRHHFFDPTKAPAIGLTDGGDGGAKPSFVWATSATGNSRRWQHARDFQFGGLTLGSRLEREQAVAQMLYTLGFLLHLNQDLTVPAQKGVSSHS